MNEEQPIIYNGHQDLCQICEFHITSCKGNPQFLARFEAVPIKYKDLVCRCDGFKQKEDEPNEFVEVWKEAEKAFYELYIVLGNISIKIMEGMINAWKEINEKNE